MMQQSSSLRRLPVAMPALLFIFALLVSSVPLPAGAQGQKPGPRPQSPTTTVRAAQKPVQALPSQPVPAAIRGLPSLDLSLRSGSGTTGLSGSILLVLVLAILPGLLTIVTCYLRISVVLDFVKRGLSLQGAPSAQIMGALALVLTLFVMWPTIVTITDGALTPLIEGRMDVQAAFEVAEPPLRLFMYRQLRSDTDSIRTFMAMSGLPRPVSLADVPTYVLVPAYALHELTVAFRIGILILIPFILIDMLVAAVLVAMGMPMLPPVVIAVPVKLAVFVIADGWNLLFRQLFLSFS